jgi:hypothetical protein
LPRGSIEATKRADAAVPFAVVENLAEPKLVAFDLARSGPNASSSLAACAREMAAIRNIADGRMGHLAFRLPDISETAIRVFREGMDLLPIGGEAHRAGRTK